MVETSTFAQDICTHPKVTSSDNQVQVDLNVDHSFCHFVPAGRGHNTRTSDRKHEPNGPYGEASEIAEMPPGLYTFQESHLTSQGIRKFKQELSWCQTGYRICHGHPAPPKNDSVRTIGGRHTGTGVLTPYPCRPVEHHWSQEQYRSGRCHAAVVLMQKRWITVGTVYGFSERSHCLDVQQQTGLLLDGLTTRVVEGAEGMRVITGDWNQERQNLPQADQWEAMGWMEAQAFAQWRWSQTPLATCRRTTVKDYI